MKFEDIPAEIICIRLKNLDHKTEQLKEYPVESIQLEANGEFKIQVNHTIRYFQAVKFSDLQKISLELSRGYAWLAQLKNPANDGSIELHIAFFVGQFLEMDIIDIGVDDHIKLKLDQDYQGDLYKGLEKDYSIIHNHQSYFFLIAGAAIQEDIKDEKINQSFCIVNNNSRLIIDKIKINHKDIFMIKRINKNNIKDKAIRLAKGQINFNDLTRTGGIQVLAQAQIANLTQDKESYLKKWDEFGDLEGELLLKQAREINVLKYDDFNLHRDGIASVRIIQACDSAQEALIANEINELALVEEIPDYLIDEDISFREFAMGIEQSFKRNTEKFYFKVLSFNQDSMELKLKTEEELPKTGQLILSLAGEIAQIKRRMQARKAIIEGRSANPQLGILIEEKGEMIPTRPLPKIKAFSAFVRNKVFRNPPTLKQEQAVEVALNTPDIALIQGPPGTGKTTVIAAILERLNELANKKNKDIKGSVLLTAFQHDAVENMISRLSLNGLPVPKFGKRYDQDDYDLFEEKLEKWCFELADSIREKHPDIKNTEKEKEIKNMYIQYLKIPSQSLALNLVKKISTLHLSIQYEAKMLLDKLSLEKKLITNNNASLNTVRCLRTRAISFADDGPERAADALKDLDDLIHDDDKDLLKKASHWYKDEEPPFLKDLFELKKRLLIKLTTPPVFRVDKKNQEVIDLVESALNEIEEKNMNIGDKKISILANFLSELENNPQGMIDAISEYSFAFSSTVQQSVNQKMQKLKELDKDKKLEYEFVIIDEAARVSPRDLMIPMAQGKRIILVGDHRQLPHLIDEEIARQMERGETGEKELNWIKKSMFQYLFSERLKQLEENDHIIRRVTLDKQFRMHPILGEFISQNFYERFDPSEKFYSGRPASDFDHHLPGTDNQAAIWLDIPVYLGKQQRRGTSWIRAIEAKMIIQKLKEWMLSKEGQHLSFGIISFYKAQSDLIKGLIEKESDINPKKIRVGTVDSFQGMEFDVVFLSIVRTLLNKLNYNILNEEKARRIFGHLCLYNRLNVAMSRQKKLLVLVGDSELINNQLAKRFVPGLNNFYDLCLNHGKIILCE